MTQYREDFIGNFITVRIEARMVFPIIVLLNHMLSHYRLPSKGIFFLCFFLR
jgi:hypothetical protein